MTTREAIQGLAALLNDELVVCTTGYTCRDMQAIQDRPGNFYMIGSMGLAAPIGLGLALNHKSKRVVVLDGDGALLMGLGILPMVGSLAVKNFVHVVLDNGVFASTGKQPTYAQTIALDKLALAAGYPVVERISDQRVLKALWEKLPERSGPVFLLIECQADSGKPEPRVRLLPEQISARFMEVVHS